MTLIGAVGSYTFADEQSEYSTAPADWATTFSCFQNWKIIFVIFEDVEDMK